MKEINIVSITIDSFEKVIKVVTIIFLIPRLLIWSELKLRLNV